VDVSQCHNCGRQTVPIATVLGGQKSLFVQMLLNYLRNTRLKGARAENAWQAAAAINAALLALALPWCLDAVVDYKKKHYPPNIVRSEFSRKDLMMMLCEKRNMLRNKASTV
jgi:hypothetical protein